MASIRQRGPNWHVRISMFDGRSKKEKSISLCTTSKVEAFERKKEVERVESHIKDGTITDLKAYFPWLNNEGTSKIVRLSLSESADKWLTTKKRDGIRENTIQIYTTALNHLIDLLGSEFHIEGISSENIERFKDWSVECRNHSPTTVNMNLRAIGTFLTWLIDKGTIEKEIRIRKIQVDEPDVKYLTEGEIADLLRLDLSRERQAINKTWVGDWEHFRNSFWFYLNTGCRLREPFLGKINDMWLDIPAHQSKNHRARHIELNPQKLEILKEMRERVRGSKNFKSRTDQYQKVFRRARKLLGIGEDITLHNLRHTYGCIRRLELSGNILSLRDELGHHSVVTTERYCRIPLKRLKQDFPSYAETIEKSILDTKILDIVKNVV